MVLPEQSQMMLTSSTSVNEDYVSSMQQLSQDIGSMAADRIVLTQQIQSQNLQITQQNILKAAENFNQLMTMFAN